MKPEGESPLLLPANQHKQLVVIDFEYSNANVPGLEFANHFVSQLDQVTLLLADLYRLNGVTTTTTPNIRSHARPTTTPPLKSNTASFEHTSSTLRDSPPQAEPLLTLLRPTSAPSLPLLALLPSQPPLPPAPSLRSCWTRAHPQANLTSNRKLKLSATRKKRPAV